MRCEYCGIEIPENEDICPGCGAKVKRENKIPEPSPFFASGNVGIPPVPGEEPPVPKMEWDPESQPSFSAPVEPVSRTQTLPPRSNARDDRSSLATASLVLGILGLFANVLPGIGTIFTSIPAIILGAMSLKSANKNQAIAGLVLGILEVVILIILVVVLGVALFSNNQPMNF